MKFRELDGHEECRILFIRHGDHGKDGAIKNQLTPEAIAQAEATGRAIHAAGIEIAAAYSSPQNRAHSTVEHVLVGYGKLVPIRTNDRLGDFEMDGINVTTLKAFAQKRGISAEEACVTPGNGLDPIMVARGHDGASELASIAVGNLSRTVVVGSHGGSRMELAINALRDIKASTLKELGPPKQMIAPGQIVELIIDSEGELIEENYLEPPA